MGSGFEKSISRDLSERIVSYNSEKGKSEGVGTKSPPCGGLTGFGNLQNLDITEGEFD